MKVRMLTTVASADRTLMVGEEYDLDEAEARDMCARPEDMPRAEPVAHKQAQRRETRTSKAARETR